MMTRREFVARAAAWAVGVLVVPPLAFGMSGHSRGKTEVVWKLLPPGWRAGEFYVERGALERYDDVAAHQRAHNDFLRLRLAEHERQMAEWRDGMTHPR